ncbi:recombinase [Sinomonas cyclohexanicum]|uniref:Recombinase n=1 Tax=Sinomonas cyclohexanicum TaxID=322009 RepID=A0ABM7PVZ7_SINCY|nr:recombinase [Corynebacterium cyclohexanicum]
MTGEEIESLRPRRAVLYLRVSSKKQTETAIDIDKDGNSIATQRDVCEQKAGDLGAEILQEFVEPGVSAQTIEKRPVFKDMMEFLAEHRDVDFVIVYARSRAFRNFVDAAITKRHLDKLGVRLLSAREDFGEGTYAEAMEAVTDIMNQVQNQLSGEDIRIKMRNKAINGGTIGRAKLGYLNVRKDIEGRLINTVELDETRAPLILKAWELYATGDYTLDRLEDAMADLGLTTKATAKSPERPVTAAKFHQMLRDPYYAGYVVYKGDVYPGRHEPIVGHDLFERVQEVADLRSRRGQRDRVHHHYLKGQLYCQRCHENGQLSRLVFTEAIGSGGTYQYFVCLQRKHGACDLPYLAADRVEDALVDHYKALRLPTNFLNDLRDRVDEALANEQGSIKEVHARINRQLKELETQEERLIDLAADGLLPQHKIRAKLHEIQFQKTKARDSLATTSAELTVGGHVFRTALDLIKDPSGIYERLTDRVRRLMNEALFERIYVNERPTVSTRMASPFADIYAAKAVWEAPGAPRGGEATTGQTERRPRDAGAPESVSLFGVYSTNGSNKTPMVEVRGFEPLTFCMPCRRATNCAIPPWS